LDYRSLFANYFIKGERVIFFELLIENLLVEATNPITTKKIGDEWYQLKEDITNKKIELFEHVK